jgi:hypothetical protein
MGKFDEPSRCSSGRATKFRWFGYPPAEDGRDFQAVLDKFQAVIDAPHRITNDYVWAMAKAEVKSRLKLAAAGKLSAPNQVKPVDVRNPPPMYEIRWQGITVRQKLNDGTIGGVEILVRMYHSEPSEAPEHFIGHHIHEKDVSDPSEANRLQNDEIRVALNYFELGKPNLWDISELTYRDKSIK